jgi:hypothetical protein
MSAFDLSVTSNLDNTSKILYNYYNTTIGSSDVEVINSSGSKYYNIIVSYPVNTPNVLYPDSLGTFIANKIYLSGIMHTIKQFPTTNTVGELIIEHTPLTGTGKLFVCILLNYSDSIVSDKNSVDDLIDIASSDDTRKQIALNSSILTQPNAIVYKDNGNTIIVFVSPIYISKASKNKITSLANPPLFSNYSSTYKILPQNSISMVDKDEIYIDCSPTGASAEEIATYNVPINSEYTQDAGKLDFMKTTIQLCLVFLLIVITYYSVPFFYKTIVVDNIKKLIQTDIEKKNRNNAIDIILVILSILLLIYVTYDGVSNDNFDGVLSGVYFFVIFGLSVAIIGYNREANYFDDDYKNAGSNTNNNLFDSSGILFLEMVMFLKDSFIFTFIGPRTGDDTVNYKNIINICGLYGITAFILLILRYAVNIIAKDVFTLWLKIMAIVIIFGVSMISLINKTNSESMHDDSHKFI